MRIGATVINTGIMDSTDIQTIIDELEHIKARKLKAESLVRRMKELLEEADANEMFFMDEFGMGLDKSMIEIFDTKSV